MQKVTFEERGNQASASYGFHFIALDGLKDARSIHTLSQISEDAEVP